MTQGGRKRLRRVTCRKTACEFSGLSRMMCQVFKLLGCEWLRRFGPRFRESLCRRDFGRLGNGIPQSVLLRIFSYDAPARENAAVFSRPVALRQQYYCDAN